MRAIVRRRAYAPGVHRSRIRLRRRARRRHGSGHVDGGRADRSQWTGVGYGRGNVPKFMSAFSKDMPDYETLENNVTALVNQAEISSSIQPLTEDGDDQARKIDLDWLLEVRSLEQDGPHRPPARSGSLRAAQGKEALEDCCAEAARFLRAGQVRKVMTRCAGLLVVAASLLSAQPAASSI